MNKQELESKVSNLPNTFQHPNWHVDQLMHLLTSDEFKVLSFIVRHTLGWQNERISRQRNISLTMFQGGFVTSESIHYGGTGLSHSSITQSLKNLVSFGLILEVHRDIAKGTLWELPAQAKIRWDLLRDRQNQKAQDSKRRTGKARAASLAKRSVGQNTENIVEVFCGTEQKTSVGQNESNPTNPIREANASLSTATRREPITFPVPGLTAQLLAAQETKKNGSKKKRTADKVVTLQVELTPLEDAIARLHYGWSVKDRAKWNQDRWDKLAEIKLAYEECGMQPEDVAKFKAWYDCDQTRFGWDMPGQAKLCGWVGKWRASLPKADAASGDNISLTPLQKRFVQQFGVSPAVAAQTEVEVILSQLQSVGDSPEFLQGLVG
jgi:hypothetical protein